LPHPPRDLVVRKEVALLRAHGACERTELAVLDANVREIDIAVDNVRDLVTHLLPAQLVCDEAQRVEVRSPCLIQRDAVVHANLSTVEASLQDRANVGRYSLETGFESSRHGVASSV
jgi:hypothetical protein